MQEHDKYFSSDQDPYMDQQTQTLKNIPNLQTPEKLEAFEEVIFQASFTEASDYIAKQKFIDLSSWKAVHKICFADVYSWAGELRTIRIAKGKTVFSYPENIEQEADKYFSEINQSLKANSLTTDQAARYFAEINVLHPFREGNGRTQRILFTELYRRMGYVIDYSLTNQDEMIDMMIAGYNGDYGPITALFQKLMHRP